MSTKSLTTVKLNGEYKIAQYGHYDGYPLGQGLTALTFLIHMNKAQFLENLKKVRFAITEQEINEVRKKTREYDGAEILDYVEDNKNCVLENYLELANDCEWVYIIDFDENTFEIYSAYLISENYHKAKKKNGFEKLNLLKKYDLNKLPFEEEFSNDFSIV